MFRNPGVLFRGEKRLLELVALIYGAVEEPPLWSAVLDRIADATNSGCTCLLSSERTMMALTRADPSYLDAYANHFHDVNVLYQRAARMFPDSAVRYSHLTMSDQEFEKTEFCNDYFRPEEYFYSFGIKILLPGQRIGRLASLRSKQKGPYQEAEGKYY